MLDKSLEAKIEKLFLRSNEETFMERIKYTFESEDMFAGESDAVRYGHTLQHILQNITVIIDKDMQIMGRVVMEIPTEEQIDEILVRYHSWWDMSIEERHKIILFYYHDGWLKCRPYWFTSFGHLGFDYPQLLEVGYGGLKQQAQERLKRSCNPKQKEFLEGVTICMDAFSMFYKRYAKAAREEGREEVAIDFEAVSEGAPTTFRQALQLIWLNTLVSQKIAGCGVLNFGRMDKYLQPLYEADIQKGLITKEEALQLIEEFYYRNNEFMEQTDHMSEEMAGTSDTLELAFDDPNYLILGGLNADGSSAVCELSRLMIQAADEMRLRNPFIVVRYHEGIEETFWKQCCEAMRNNATVVVYNDDTMIPALKYCNVDEPEVYEYGFWGCNDPNIPGQEGSLRQLWMNMPKALELAMFSGDYPMEPRKSDMESRQCEFPLIDRMTGLMVGPYYGIETKPVQEMKSMQEFLDAFEAQMAYLIGEFRKGFEADLEIERQHTFGKMRIEDCFLKGTIDGAVTWSEGGCKYHKIVTQGSGLATVINSLYIIEEVVFNKQEMTFAELAEMLRTNYAGKEQWSLKFKNKYPKFGNDIEAVDKYAKIVTDMFIRCIDANNGPEYLYQMWPTYSTDRAFTLMGEQEGATPDGRFQKEPLSENQSPAEGSDMDGVTAMLNSLSKVPFNRITGGPLNLRLHPSTVQGDMGVEVISSLFKTYMQEGGMQLQVNVIDANTLIDAQKNPDKYRSLCVRVTGYSAYFVEMGAKAQNELIARTVHQI